MTTKAPHPLFGNLAVAIHDVNEAADCILYAVASTARPPIDVTIIGMPRMPWLWWYGIATGWASRHGFELEALGSASCTARSAMQLLPESVTGRYLVCWRWRSPSLRDYLISARCNQVIVARRRWRIPELLVRLALRGTGIRVRSATIRSRDRGR